MDIKYSYSYNWCLSDFDYILASFIEDMKEFLKDISDVTYIGIEEADDQSIVLTFNVIDSDDNYGCLNLAYIFDDLEQMYEEFLLIENNNKF